MAEFDEQYYVSQCLEGNKDAFGFIVDKYERAIFNIALRIVKEYDDARDITQSVFVKAYEKLDSYNSSFKFFSWIYRIAINESLNFVNRKKPDETVDERFVAPTISPVDQLQVSELNASIQQALARLKPDYRAVIVLKHFKELSYREMSEVLQIPEKTVKSRLFSARQLLKVILVEQGIVGNG